MTGEPVACRLCGGNPIVSQGAIPDSDYFAGRILPQAIRGGSLWECKACRSMFRHPVEAPATYLEMYSQGIANAWSAESARLDLKIVRGFIAQKASSGRVLDVGCGSGEFLLTLPAGLEKHGIEPSIAAGLLAVQSGIRIVGRTLRDLPPEARYDVVTVIDVIEHVADPAALLDEIMPHLAPEGCLIVSTGDPGNALWRRVFGARFWYSSFPEHISFPSLEFFRNWQQSRAVQPPIRIRTRYRDLSLWRTGLAFLAQMAYLLSPSSLNMIGRGIQWLRRAPLPHRRFFSAGGLGAFTDHQVVMIQATATRSPAS